MGRKNTKQSYKKIKAFLSGTFLLLGSALPMLPAEAQIPQTINYQSRLRTNAQQPITASTTIQFSLYNHPTNGSPADAASQSGALVWKETYNQNSGSCIKIQPDSRGYFYVQLGSCVSFPSYIDFNTPLYLGVKIESDAEATPRVLLASHPYALNSQRVNSLEATTTATAGQLLALEDDLDFNIATGTFYGGGLAINGTSTLQNLTFTVSTGTSLNLNNYLSIGAIRLDATGSNNVTSGASLVGVFDEFVNSNATTVQAVLADLDTVITAVSSTMFSMDLQQVTDNGATTTNWIEFAGATSVGDVLPGANNAYSLGDTANRWSDLWAANLHIGTSTWALAQAAAGALTFSHNVGGEIMRMAANGYVGIGTSTPAYKLDVDGTVRLASQLLLGRYASLPGSGYQDGALVYKTSSSTVHYWDGTQWRTVATAEDVRSSLWDADHDTGVQVEESADEDVIRFDTAGVERMYIANDGKVGVGTTETLSALFTVGPGAHEASVFSVYGDPAYYNIANFRDEDGESIFRANGSVAGGDLLVTFGDKEQAGDGTYLGVDYANDSINLSNSELRFQDDNRSNYVALIAPAVLATNTTWILPSTDGTQNGQALATNASGTLYWRNVDGAGSVWDVDGDTGMQVDNGTDNDQIEFFSFGNKIAQFGKTPGNYSFEIYDDSGNRIIGPGVNYQNSGAGAEVQNIGIGDLDAADNGTWFGVDTGDQRFGFNEGDVVFVSGKSGTAITEYRELVTNGTNYVGFRAPTSVASNVAWTLPNADGSSNQVLVTNGLGTLNWATSSDLVDNIYTTDGSLSGDRTVSGDGVGLTVNTTNGGYFYSEIHDGTDYSFIHNNPDEIEINSSNGGSAYAGMVFNSGGASFTHSQSGSSTQFYIGSTMTLADGINFRGINYASDYSANYTNRTLVDKGYVDSAITSSTITAGNGLTLNSGTINLGGTLTQTTYLDHMGYDFVVREFAGEPETLFSGDNFKIIDTNRNRRVQFGISGDDTSGVQWRGDAQHNIYYRDNALHIESNTSSFAGMQYALDYSGNYTARSLVDKAYVDAMVTGTTAGLTFQNVADNTIASDGYVYYETGAAAIEDDGGAYKIEARAGGYEVAMGQADGSRLAFKSYNGVLNPAEILLYDLRDPGERAGIEYAADYSSDYTLRSLVDKAYVDAAVSSSTLFMADADGDTMIQVEESADEDYIRFDTAGQERMYITNSGALHFADGGYADAYFNIDNPSNPYIGDPSLAGMYLDSANDRVSLFGTEVYVKQKLGVGVTDPNSLVDIGEGMIANPRGDASVLLSWDGGDSFFETASTDMAEGLLMLGAAGDDSEYGVIRNVASTGYANGWDRGLHLFTSSTGAYSDPIIFSTDSIERMRILDDGSVGIGTSTPSARLGINYVTSSVSQNNVGLSVNVEQTSSNPSPNSTKGAQINTVISGSGTQYVAYGYNSYLYNSGAGDVTYGMAANNRLINDGTGAITNAYATYNFFDNDSSYGDTDYAFGSYNRVRHNATTTINNAAGNYNRITNANAGTIINAFGNTVQVQNSNASGVINNAYGLAVDGWSNSGTINNAYGVFVGNSVNVGTNNWAFYSSSVADSYLAGNLGIGTVSPDNNFHVMESDSGGTSLANTIATFEENDHAYMQFLVPNNRSTGLLFGDNDTANVGGLFYTHSIDMMQFRVAGDVRANIDSSGHFTLNNGVDPGNAILDVRGDAIFNEDGEDYDFRIESVSSSNMFFVDASENMLGIGTSTPAYTLDVSGDARITAELLLGRYAVNPISGSQPGSMIYNTASSTPFFWNGSEWKALTYVDAATLDAAYDAGGSGLGRQITADAGAVYLTGAGDGTALQLDYSGTGQGFVINYSGTRDAISISSSNSGNSIHVSNNANGKAFTADNNSTGVGVEVINNNTGRGVDISNVSSGVGINLLNAGSGMGVYLRQNNGIGFQLDNNTANNGMLIDTNSTGDGLAVLNNGSGSDGIRIDNDTNGAGLYIEDTAGKAAINISKPEGTGDLLYLNNEGTGDGIDLTHTTSGKAIRITNTGIGDSLYINDEAADATPFVLDSDGGMALGGEFSFYANSGSSRYITVDSVTGFSDEGTDLRIQAGGGVAGEPGDLHLYGGSSSGLYGTIYLAEMGGRVIVGSMNGRSAMDVTGANEAVVTFDRTTSDGTVVSIRQDGVEEGTISISGNTVSYNAFTGSHYAWTNEEIEKGMLVSLTGENRYLHDDTDSEILYGITLSSTINDAQIMGSYLALLESSKEDDEHNPHLVMAVGNGEVWVADKGENVNVGDYLISSDIAGHAEKDTGEFTVSHIVARAAESVDWTHVAEDIDGVKHKKISVFFEAFDKNNMHSSIAGTSLQGGDTLLDAEDLVVANAVFEGHITVKGHAAFSEDTVGQAMIMTGDTRVSVSFKEEYGTLPIVTLTPANKVTTSYWVENASLQGFDIVLDEVQYEDILFNWHAFGNDEGRVYVSNGTTMEIEVNDMGSSALETEINSTVPQDEENATSTTDVLDEVTLEAATSTEVLLDNSFQDASSTTAADEGSSEEAYSDELLVEPELPEEEPELGSTSTTQL